MLRQNIMYPPTYPPSPINRKMMIDLTCCDVVNSAVVSLDDPSAYKKKFNSTTLMSPDELPLILTQDLLPSSSSCMMCCEEYDGGVRKPIRLHCPGNHVICLECVFPSTKNMQKCPYCQVEICECSEVDEPPPMKLMCCGSAVKFSAIYQHKCQFLVRCVDCNLPLLDIGDNAKMHLLADCPSRKTQCSDCSEWLPLPSQLAHGMDNCSGRFISCPLCQQSVRVRDFDNHSNNAHHSPSEFLGHINSINAAVRATGFFPPRVHSDSSPVLPPPPLPDIPPFTPHPPPHPPPTTTTPLMSSTIPRSRVRVSSSPFANLRSSTTTIPTTRPRSRSVHTPPPAREKKRSKVRK